MARRRSMRLAAPWVPVSLDPPKFGACRLWSSISSPSVRQQEFRSWRPDGGAVEGIVLRGRGDSVLVDVQQTAANAGRARPSGLQLRNSCCRTDGELIEDHSRQAPNFGGSKLTGTQGAARRMDLRRALLERRRHCPSVAMIAVGLLAAVDRFYRLTGRSLWLDETVTAQSAHLNSTGAVIAQSHLYVN